MEKVENGNYISVEYTGTLGNGEVFDSSRGRRPLEVHMGAGQMISGFEAQLVGMALNEKKVFTLGPEEAYGQKRAELVHSVPRSQVPPGMELEIGMTIGLSTPDGRHIPARIVAVDNDTVTLDLNHPLAGESLTFNIEVVGISNEPTQECEEGSCDCGCSGDCGSGDCGGH